MQSNSDRITGYMRKRISSYNIFSYALAIFYALLLIIPLYYMFVSSFKDNSEIFGDALGLPNIWSLKNYIRAQESVDLIRAMAISFGITTTTELLNLLLSFSAAYAIARIPTRLARFGEIFFGMGFLIPAFAVLVPVYLMAAKTGLLYSPLSVVLFYTGARLPLTIVLLSSYMREIPRELEEVAWIDGANRFGILYHVFFPMARAGIITVLVINFIDLWNEYLFAFILLSSESRTVQLALPFLKGYHQVVEYGLVSAGVLVSLIPVYLVFILFQEQIMEGSLAGAIK
jgi:multiple sugar transport system permease protein